MFVRGPDGALALHALPPPSDADVEAILARVARRVLAALRDTGDSHADDGLDAWTADLGAALQPTLPHLATDDPPRRPPRPRLTPPRVVLIGAPSPIVTRAPAARLPTPRPPPTTAPLRPAAPPRRRNRTPPSHLAGLSARKPG